jgi:hypothetical protein
VLIIDEAFAWHAPSWAGFRKKCRYVPLPQEGVPNDDLIKSTEIDQAARSHTIGILGNIETSWLAHDFKAFYKEARENGYRLLIATSNSIDPTQFSAEGISCVIPWPKSQTDRVFAQCSAILVPLSVARLIYSSPSKIIDCYSRGIQPVVMVDKLAWDKNKGRAIYQKCVHVSDFFSDKKQYASHELLAYSQVWVTALD